jgi:hypothetical protein
MANKMKGQFSRSVPARPDKEKLVGFISSFFRTDRKNQQMVAVGFKKK